MSIAASPIVLTDDPSLFRIRSHTLTWSADPEARLAYALKPETAYIYGINRGKTLSGTQILQAFQAVAEARRIKVIGVDFLTVGFWEKMVERSLIHDWSMENPKMLL